jgi:hypothetical protein
MLKGQPVGATTATVAAEQLYLHHADTEAWPVGSAFLLSWCYIQG